MPIPAQERVNEVYDGMYCYLPEFFRRNDSGQFLNDMGTVISDVEGNITLEGAIPAPKVSSDDGGDISVAAGQRRAEMKRWINIALQIHAKHAVCTYYCAAHLITMADSGLGLDLTSGTGGGSRVIERLRVDQMEVEYEDSGGGGGEVDQESEFFQKTSYGKMFLEMERRKSAPTLLVV